MKLIKKTLMFLAALALATSTFAVEVGQPAPDFTGTDIYGKTVKLSDYQGKIVVLESYNSDCPFCKNHYRSGAVQELQKEFTGKGVIWLLVDSVNQKNFSYRPPEQARAEWQTKKMQATDWIDDHSGTIGHLYDMKTTPHLFVIDQKGILVYDGAMDDHPQPFGDPRKAKNYVRAALDAVLAGQPVAIAQTKPYGCAVHYAD